MLHRFAVVLLIALEASLISSAPLTIHRGEPTLLNFEPTEAKSLQHERPVATTTLPNIDANNFTCPGELIEVTVPPGTAPRGSECVFPFEYHGTNYTQCTPVDNAGVAWCYTNLTSGLYGNCVCRLPQGLDAPAEPYGSPERTYEDAICDVGGPACMGYCVIPVTYGGCPSALQPLMSNCTDYNFMMDNCTLREGLWDEATQSPTLPRCDAAGDGELCEGLGECGTNSTLNNCGAFGQAPYYRSIYRKVPRSWTSHRPGATSTTWNRPPLGVDHVCNRNANLEIDFGGAFLRSEGVCGDNWRPLFSNIQAMWQSGGPATSMFMDAIWMLRGVFEGTVRAFDEGSCQYGRYKDQREEACRRMLDQSIDMSGQPYIRMQLDRLYEQQRDHCVNNQSYPDFAVTLELSIEMEYSIIVGMTHGHMMGFGRRAEGHFCYIGHIDPSFMANVAIGIGAEYSVGFHTWNDYRLIAGTAQGTEVGVSFGAASDAAASSTSSSSSVDENDNTVDASRVFDTTKNKSHRREIGRIDEKMIQRLVNESIAKGASDPIREGSVASAAIHEMQSGGGSVGFAYVMHTTEARGILGCDWPYQSAMRAIGHGVARQMQVGLDFLGSPVDIAWVAGNTYVSPIVAESGDYLETHPPEIGWTWDDENHRCWDNSTYCFHGSSCKRCLHTATWWYGFGVDGFRCGIQPRWSDGTYCFMGTSCNTCGNPATWWFGMDILTQGVDGFRCGTQPRFADGEYCLMGTSCNVCATPATWWYGAGLDGYRCGNQPRFPNGQYCLLGTSCNTCQNPASWWYGNGVDGTRCGQQHLTRSPAFAGGPSCWGHGTYCFAGTSCNACCTAANWWFWPPGMHCN